jgi:hypothetical protein
MKINRIVYRDQPLGAKTEKYNYCTCAYNLAPCSCTSRPRPSLAPCSCTSRPRPKTFFQHILKNVCLHTRSAHTAVWTCITTLALLHKHEPLNACARYVKAVTTCVHACTFTQPCCMHIFTKHHMYVNAACGWHACMCVCECHTRCVVHCGKWLTDPRL